MTTNKVINNKAVYKCSTKVKAKIICYKQKATNYTYIFRTIFLVIKYNISAIMSVQRQEICKLFETGFIIYKIMT